MRACSAGVGRLEPLQRLDDLVLFAQEMFESLHSSAKRVPVALAKRRLRLHQASLALDS